MLLRIWVAVEPARQRQRIERILERSDLVVFSGTAGKSLWESLSREACDLLIVSPAALREPLPEFVAAARRLPERPEVVCVTMGDGPEERAQIMVAGCRAVVPLELSDATLEATLTALVRGRRDSLVRRPRTDDGSPTAQLGDFVSSSPSMLGLLSVARRVAASDASLLILGETGVGKEWLARAIHADGLRAYGPFVAVNCAAIPESLLESELFGHEQGAFTGATRSRRGRFELAHKGTLFLDEIGDMEPGLQAKLLRVLQERAIQRVGAESTIQTDVRVIAATHIDLEQAMREGRFRRDLFYRLSVVSLSLPPLRERREDIVSLLESYLSRFAAQFARPVAGFAPEVLSALLDYAWPGNVRELINVVERGVLLCQGRQITTDDLPESIMRSARAASEATARPLGNPLGEPEEWLGRPLKEVRDELWSRIEMEYLSARLRETGGRVGEAARRSGLSERTLFEKMKQLRLRKEDFRQPGGGAGGA